MDNSINLNADLGESYGAYTMGDDASMMEIINSANIACGYHAGDPLVMSRAVVMAEENQVSIGAHPSFPDLQGFGRRNMSIPMKELEAMLHYQIGALQGVASPYDAQVTHVKPHGALNNMAAEDKELALCIANAVWDIDANLILLAPACSKLSEAGKEVGLLVANEIFADRAYAEDGSLLPRSEEGAVLHDSKACIEQVINFLYEDGIVTQSGNILKTDIHSICVHGDSPDSVNIAKSLKLALEEEGFSLNQLPLVIDHEESQSPGDES